MYFINSVAYNGLQGAQSRKGHVALAARWELGKSNDVVIHESLFVQIVQGNRSGLLGMSSMLE